MFKHNREAVQEKGLEQSPASRSVRIFTALFYAGSSFLIMMANKYALYYWQELQLTIIIC